MQDQIANCLPKEVFPWLREPTSEELGVITTAQKIFRFATSSNGLIPPDPNHPNSLRTTRATWGSKRAAKTPGKDSSGEMDENELRRNGSRIILFCLGGLTYSEIRSAYEVTKDDQREVLFGTSSNAGSTYTYNPTQFVELLKNIHKGDEGLGICASIFNVPAKPQEDIALEKEKTEKKGIFSKKK